MLPCTLVNVTQVYNSLREPSDETEGKYLAEIVDLLGLPSLGRRA